MFTLNQYNLKNFYNAFILIGNHIPVLSQLADVLPKILYIKDTQFSSVQFNLNGLIGTVHVAKASTVTEQLDINLKTY